MQRKPEMRGGERWASLILSGAACAATGREMFLFWFCNLTIVAGKVGVPTWKQGQVARNRIKMDFFFIIILARWKGNKKGIWAWRGKGHYRLWRILEPKVEFSKLRDELNFPNNICKNTQIKNPSPYELEVYLVWPLKPQVNGQSRTAPWRALAWRGSLVLAPWGRQPSLEHSSLRAM